MSHGAGGTEGGSGSFLMGLIMLCGGGYMLLSAITVKANFAMGMSLYRMPVYGMDYLNITSGMIMVPFVLGVGMIFYNGRSIVGWLVALLSITAMIFGVIANTKFQLRAMNAFELSTMLVLAVGGFGLLLRSLRPQKSLREKLKRNSGEEKTPAN